MAIWMLLGLALTAAEKPNPLVEALARCLEIKTDAERLECTDIAGARLVAAQRARQVVVITSEEVRKTKRSLFGLAIDENAVFAGREAPADRVDRLETIVTIANANGDRWSLTLAEGGRWRTTEPWTNAIPKAGMTVTIHRGALGSYVLNSRGERAVRVMRLY